MEASTRPEGNGLRPCVFFDRDGVVNVSPGAGYVTRVEDFVLNEGIVDCLRVAKERGYVCVLVTSQRCVGKGLITRDGLAAIHARMVEWLASSGVGFLDIYAFTGLPETATWEKPSPVMIERAATKHGLDLARSWMVGDADRDIEMAHRAGVGHTLRIAGEREVTVAADYVVEDVRAAAAVLANHLVAFHPEA